MYPSGVSSLSSKGASSSFWTFFLVRFGFSLTSDSSESTFSVLGFAIEVAATVDFDERVVGEGVLRIIWAAKVEAFLLCGTVETRGEGKRDTGLRGHRRGVEWDWTLLLSILPRSQHAKRKAAWHAQNMSRAALRLAYCVCALRNVWWGVYVDYTIFFSVHPINNTKFYLLFYLFFIGSIIIIVLK